MAMTRPAPSMRARLPHIEALTPWSLMSIGGQRSRGCMGCSLAYGTQLPVMHVRFDGFRPMMVTGATMKCPVGMLQVENRNIAMLSTTLNRKPEFQSVRRGCHGIVCMANSRRIARVSKQIEREIGSLLISDKVVMEAVCPERKRGIDDGLSALASITEVDISNDLQVAKVYLSIYSDEAGKAAAMRGLQRLEGYVRKHIGRQIRLRLTPEIRFILDDSMERSERVLSLLKQVEAINAGEAPPPPVVIPEDDDDDVGDEMDDDDDVLISVDLGFFDEAGETSGRKKNTSSRLNEKKSEKMGEVPLSEGDVNEMLSMFRDDAKQQQGSRSPNNRSQRNSKSRQRRQ